MEYGIGISVLRKEDQRLLTGQGRFSDDFTAPDQLYGYVLRSPYAHAEIRSIDVAPAQSMPGVVAVFTAADYVGDGGGPIPYGGGNRDIPLANSDGTPMIYPAYLPLAADKVRFVGQGVALVVAETLAQAKDAAEAVAVDYQPLDAVVSSFAALADGAPSLWDELPNNCSVDFEMGDKAATEAAFARATHVVSVDIHNNRVCGVPMEPRAILASFDPASERYTVHYGSSAPVRHRSSIARALGIDESQVQVLCQDVGGGFGTRGIVYPEEPLLAWAAKRLGRPVKWTSDRSECFLSDAQARDIFIHAELAMDADGRFLGMRTDNICNMGPVPYQYTPLVRGISVTTGVYDIPAVSVHGRAALANVSPLTTYRGAGRPEAMFLIERLIEVACRELGFDKIALRRKNLIPPTAFPYDNGTYMTFDSGEFARSMDMAMELADWDGFEARRAEARGRGVYRGIGIANYIETATGQPYEQASIDIDPAGRVDIICGTQSTGMSHETSYAQLINTFLGVPFDCVTLHEGDTDLLTNGSGSQSSRSMRLAGWLYGRCANEIIDKGRRIAAHMLEAAPDDIEFAEARFTVAGTDRSVTLFEAAGAARDHKLPAELDAEMGGRLFAFDEITKLIPAFPNGCHIVEVEVDAETGTVAIVRYTGIDDVGRVINPMLVDGQTHGGIAQGVGQALMEDCVYDSESGQLLSGSFMDYCMPRADDFCRFDLENNEVLAPSTPLGVKGAGEGGTTGAPPAVINAVVDALAEFGVMHIEMPATPQRVWRAIREARTGGH